MSRRLLAISGPEFHMRTFCSRFYTTERQIGLRLMCRTGSYQVYTNVFKVWVEPTYNLRVDSLLIFTYVSRTDNSPSWILGAVDLVDTLSVCSKNQFRPESRTGQEMLYIGFVLPRFRFTGRERRRHPW